MVNHNYWLTLAVGRLELQWGTASVVTREDNSVVFAALKKLNGSSIRRFEASGEFRVMLNRGSRDPLPGVVKFSVVVYLEVDVVQRATIDVVITNHVGHDVACDGVNVSDFAIFRRTTRRKRSRSTGLAEAVTNELIHRLAWAVPLEKLIVSQLCAPASRLFANAVVNGGGLGDEKRG